MSSKFNNNIRCIEISLYSLTSNIAFAFNNNIRCIEIFEDVLFNDGSLSLITT